jgi:hypothetical protein
VVSKAIAADGYFDRPSLLSVCGWERIEMRYSMAKLRLHNSARHGVGHHNRVSVRPQLFKLSGWLLSTPLPPVLD